MVFRFLFDLLQLFCLLKDLYNCSNIKGPRYPIKGSKLQRSFNNNGVLLYDIGKQTVMYDL